MKKILLIKLGVLVTAVTLLMNLCGCFGGGGNAEYPPQENINVNYNNITCAYYDNFWLTEDKAYYSYTPVFGTYLYEADGSGKRRLNVEKDTYACSIQEHGGYLYYHAADPGGMTFNDMAYRYDLSDGTSEILFEAENIRSMCVAGDYIYYESFGYTDSEYYIYGLFVYSAESGESVEIASDYYESCFGVLNGLLYFVCDESGKPVIKEYDPSAQSTVKIRELENNISEDINISHFSVTEKYLILCLTEYSGDDESYYEKNNLIVINNADGKITEYKFLEGETFFAPYNEYMFCAEYASDVEPDEYGYVIKRMSLSDGTAEELGTVDDWNMFYVASDETVYVSSYYDRVYRFSAGKTEGELVFHF